MAAPEVAPTGPAAAAAARLAVTHARAGAWRVLVIRGAIDLAGATRLGVTFARAVVGGSEPLALDVRDAGPDDRGSMALLVNEIRRLHHRRRDMVVACPGGPLRTALEETGIARRVTIVDDPSELHGLEAGGPRPRRSAARPRPGGRPRTSTATRRSALLAEATLVIEARHADPTLTLADVAREVATSCRQLQRVFAEQAGGTFRDELAAIRLQHAAVLVQTTDLPVAEVGRRTGYGQASHFAKMFRLHHGVRPTALRHANVGAPGPLRHRSPGRRPGR